MDPDHWRRAITHVKEFPKGVGGDNKKKVFRVEEVSCWVETPQFSYEEHKKKCPNVYRQLNEHLKMNEDTSRILVINDDGHEFRGLELSAPIIKDLAKQKQRCWLVFATTEPFDCEKGLLWKAIEESDLYDKTIVVISATNLRSVGLNIRSNVAVETAAYDLWTCAQSSSFLKKLMECQHVLVRDFDGIFHFNKSDKSHFDVYFRPFEPRPEYNPSKYGKMSGYEKIIIASIAKEMIQEIAVGLHTSRIECIPNAIGSGLKLLARQFGVGFGSSAEFPRRYFTEKGQTVPHPFDGIFKVEKGVKEPAVAWVRFPFPWDIQTPYFDKSPLKKWNRVEWLRKDWNEDKFTNFLFSIVEDGLADTIEKGEYKKKERIICPVARFGKLSVVDKEEINSFLDIHKIMQKYLEDDTWETPLSLAVFGPPGTGKSFAVGEIFKAVRLSTMKAENDDELEEPLAYNLAQFTKPENLTTAFHQAQDAALSKKVPLIFFDEFDAKLDNQDYGWLKYFLAPMQDGKFKGAKAEGSYRVGKAIFVFAGGTAKKFNEFKDNVKMEKNAKGLDFVSRLRGYLDIKGIDKNDSEDTVSDLLALRRAVILRSILERRAQQIFGTPGKKARIDKKLIKAFLRIASYHHGIRSMEAIVQMAKPERGELQVASLPSGDQLQMHVDNKEFLEKAEVIPRPQPVRAATLA